MAAGGGEVAVGILPQSGIGVTGSSTPAGANYVNIKLDEFTENVGYVTDEGRPEIGGALYTVSSSEKYGAGPFSRMVGKTRLEALQSLLPLVGWNETGAGPFTYTPSATTAAFLYYTLDFKYSAEAGNQYQIIDCKGSRLVMAFQPRQAPLFTCDLLGGNHQESTADHDQPATQTVPSPATTIAAANLTIFGTTGYKVYGFTVSIENGIDNTRQPLGQLTPDDVVPTFMSSRVDGVLGMGNADYRRLVYGGAAATIASATKVTGALNLRQLNGTKYVEVNYTAAEFFLGDPIPVRATAQVFLPFRARCTGAATMVISLT